MTNKAIIWCIQNCAAFIAHDEAMKEMTEIVNEIEQLRAALTERDAQIASLLWKFDDILPTCPVCGNYCHITTDGVKVCRTCQSCDEVMP